MEGSLYHVNNEVRVAAVKTLEQISKVYREGTIEWFKGLKGLKPSMMGELQ